MAGIKIEGGASTAGSPNVDAVFALKTNSSNHNTEPANIGSSVLVVEKNVGTYVSRKLSSPSMTNNGNLILSPRTMLWHGMFPNANQHTGNWKHLFTTMTAVQDGLGALVFNNNLTGTINTGCSMQSTRYFSYFDQATFAPVIQLGFGNGLPIAGQIINFGYGVPTATAAPTDGIWLRYVGGTGIVGVAKFGANAEVVTGTLLPASAFTVGPTYDFPLVIDERGITFKFGSDEIGSISIPSGQTNMSQNVTLPIFMQQWNIGTVSGTQCQARFSCTSVMQDDLDMNIPFGTQMAFLGQTYQGSDGGPMGSLANFANSTNPTAAVPTNTTAALGVGLGGQFWETNTLAINTDGIISSYLNPAGSTTIPAKTLVINGLKVTTAVQTTLANAGGAAYVWSIAYGHNALSLATAESASFANNTTKAPRRVPLGQQGAIGALVQGSMLTDLFVDLRGAEIIVNPGEYFALVHKNIGTVGTAGVLAHTITPTGYLM